MTDACFILKLVSEGNGQTGLLHHGLHRLLLFQEVEHIVVLEESLHPPKRIFVCTIHCFVVNSFHRAMDSFRFSFLGHFNVEATDGVKVRFENLQGLLIIGQIEEVLKYGNERKEGRTRMAAVIQGEFPNRMAK
jgi:hypothetical protein